MKCSNCGNFDAEYVVLEDNSLHVLCEGCFQELQLIFGELNLDSYRVSLVGWDAPRLVSRLNEKFRHQDSQYSELLSKYSKLRQKLLGG